MTSAQQDGGDRFARRLCDVPFQQPIERHHRVRGDAGEWVRRWRSWLGRCAVAESDQLLAFGLWQPGNHRVVGLSGMVSSIEQPLRRTVRVMLDALTGSWGEIVH